MGVWLNHNTSIELFRAVLCMSCSVVWEWLLCNCFIYGVCLDLENKMNRPAIKMYCAINPECTEDFSIRFLCSNIANCFHKRVSMGL